MNGFWSSPSRLIALCGGALFALALWGSRLASAPAPSADARALARLQVSFGRVWLDRDGRRLPVDGATSFQRFETVETAPGAEALLIFPNNEQLRIAENTVIFGDWEDGRPLLVVKSGEILGERLGDPADSVMISQNGARRPLALMRDGRRARQARKAAPVRPPRATASADRRSDTLSPQSIQDTLKQQRNLFFKCYGQLLQRTPGVSGEASLAFTIERSGRVSGAEISSSSLQDPAFRRCLTEAVKRVEFRSFAGDPVQTLFPIRFE